MGSSVTAKCKCGVEVSILVGGGMMNHTTTCNFPCLCDKCHRIIQVNLLDKEPRCPLCRACGPIPYDDARLVGRRGKSRVAEWHMVGLLGRMLVLTDGGYRCPQCGEMSLVFHNDGLYWD